MINHPAILALTYLSMTCTAPATDLSPGNGHSIRLGQFDGMVYYTVEHEGHRIVATLSSGAEAPPIRFISTLAPGQHLVISVPQAYGQPSIDFEIVRNGDALVVRDPVEPAPGAAISAAAPGSAGSAPRAAALSK